ncbi:MAG: HlyD family secretion protein [Bacteroidales bacterium]
MKLSYPLIALSALLYCCSGSNEKSDAYGNFEATEIIISAEASGRIMQFDVEEGQELKAGQQVGLIDTTDLYLKMEQLRAQKKAIATRAPGVAAQIEVQLQQKANLEVENARIDKLFIDKAATQKQMDDIKGAINLVDRQIASIKTQQPGIVEEMDVVQKQIVVTHEAINKCQVLNPSDGTVLVKYAETGELALPGKSLYKLANLSQMELRVYITGDQLPGIKIGQKVEVIIDKNRKDNQVLEGTVSWISQKAEFTPKIIQTKEERVNLVYAVKILVPNDGRIKISMPGEVNFQSKSK